ncbi:hypothetical protein BDM02DRAFT_2963273 [Thelephora ganbajun]|uniref:Uncharacterized protein n=1 Tax=Thelephora ganbajun TaxID=370292 RepID=A0ACB6ZS32_THEGA|nr:hypothetical protein BDM02DRAFT_2963273 [Thelephora ganbajun]
MTRSGYPYTMAWVRVGGLWLAGGAGTMKMTINLFMGLPKYSIVPSLFRTNATRSFSTHRLCGTSQVLSSAPPVPDLGTARRRFIFYLSSTSHIPKSLAEFSGHVRPVSILISPSIKFLYRRHHSASTDKRTRSRDPRPPRIFCVDHRVLQRLMQCIVQSLALSSNCRPPRCSEPDHLGIADAFSPPNARCVPRSED